MATANEFTDFSMQGFRQGVDFPFIDIKDMPVGNGISTLIIRAKDDAGNVYPVRLVLGKDCEGCALVRPAGKRALE
jgi:hypothetical protein